MDILISIHVEVAILISYGYGCNFEILELVFMTVSFLTFLHLEENLAKLNRCNLFFFGDFYPCHT